MTGKHSRVPPFSNPPAPPEQKEDDYDQQDQANAAAAVVPDAGAHVVTASAEE